MRSRVEQPQANLAPFQPSEIFCARYNNKRGFPFYMEVLNTIMRWRRGELVLAALLLACLLLPAAAPGAVFAGQNAQAVTLWLHSELAPTAATSPQLKRDDAFLSLQNRDNSPIYHSSTLAVLPILAEPQRLASLQIEARAPFISSLEAHESAFLTGVRNNRRRH